MIIARRTDTQRGLRRHRYFFPRKNKDCLVGLRRDKKNWRVVVEVLCRQYNHMHAQKNKCCSFQTSASRKKFYLKFFEKMSKNFQIDPRELKSKHVYEYYRSFVFESLNDGRDSKTIIKHIRTQTSYLAFFAWWIGKPNSIPTASQIIEAQGERLCRYEFSNFRASVSDSEDLVEKVEDAFKNDPRLALQMCVMGLFGLRSRESVAMRISESFVTLEGAPCIRVIRGTKGGKPRQMILREKSAIEGFKYLWDYCRRHSIDALCWPELDLEEAVKRQGKVFAKKYKLRKDAFSGSSHSFRHSFAVRMMKKTSKEEEIDSLAVSEDLGHHRTAVTAVYIGHAERGGEEAIGPLLESLSEEPQSPKTADRLMLLLKELTICRPALSFALMNWMAEDPFIENERNALELREEILVEKKDRVSRGPEIYIRLLEWLTPEASKAFLIAHAKTVSVPWLEKHILAPFDEHILGKRHQTKRRKKLIDQDSGQ